MINCNHNRKILSCKDCWENQISVLQYSANLLQDNIKQFENKHIKQNPILDRYLKDCQKFNNYEILKLERQKVQKINKINELKEMKRALSNKVYIYNEQIKQQNMRIQIDHLLSKEKTEIDNQAQLIQQIQGAKRRLKEKQQQKLQELINILSIHKNKFYYARDVIKNQQDFILLSVCDLHGFSTELKFKLDWKPTDKISLIDIKSSTLTFFLFIQLLTNIFNLELPYKINFDTIMGIDIWKDKLNSDTLNFLFIDYIYLLRRLDIHVYKEIFNNCILDFPYLIRELRNKYELNLQDNNLIYQMERIKYNEEQGIQQHEINKYLQFSCFHFIKNFQEDDDDDDFLVID
ncbi:hypothetical protein pb186bvf_010308 [Paramecium bursaria]